MADLRIHDTSGVEPRGRFPRFEVSSLPPLKVKVPYQVVQKFGSCVAKDSRVQVEDHWTSLPAAPVRRATRRRCATTRADSPVIGSLPRCRAFCRFRSMFP